MVRFIILTDGREKVRVNIAQIVAYHRDPLNNSGVTEVEIATPRDSATKLVDETPEEIDKLIQAAAHRATAFDPSEIK